MFQLTTLSTGLDNGVVPNKRQAIFWTNADPILWRICAALRVEWIILGELY